MIVKYTGQSYKFLKNDGKTIINLFFPHELESLLKGKQFETVKLQGMNIVFPEDLESVSLINLYDVAHVEIKHIVAKLIFQEQQSKIDSLSDRLNDISWRVATI